MKEDKQPTPVRVQRSRKNKQLNPNGLPIVYVGRPSEFGNPYHVGLYKDFTRQDAVRAYAGYVEDHIHLKNKIKNELKGKNLSCWCKIGEPCHADILLEIANK